MPECPVTGFDCITCEGECRVRTKIFTHAKRDPLVCSNGGKHEFAGWRDFDDGRGGERVCKHCGMGAMEHTLALDI